ncbi:MAG: outer membrane beta-barrel protein [Acidobacteriota bacterium]
MRGVLGRAGGATRAGMLAVGCVLVAAGLARAQDQTTPVGPFIVDVRGVMASFGPTEEQAAAFAYAPGDLPSLGFGVDLGAHYYPLRFGPVAVGVGGNVMFSAGHSAPEDSDGKPTGRSADTRLRAMAAQVSINFGGEGGWSYMSAGYGVTTFTISNEAIPEPASPIRRATINIGGGARWFWNDHLAFSLDLRVYRIPAATNAAQDPAAAATSRFVLGAGVSFR